MRPKLWAAAVAALAGAAWIAGATLLRVETTGAPWGPSARIGATIATLIVRLEPYVPSLHRDPANDRYAIGLLLLDARDPDARRYVPLARRQPAAVLNVARILGVAGSHIRFQVPEEGAYDLASGRITGAVAPRPEARPVPSSPGAALAALASGEHAVLQMLSSAGFVSATRFVAALSDADVQASFRPGLSIPAGFAVERSRAPRWLHVGAIEPQGTRRPLSQLARISDEALLNAAFVRAQRNGEALRLADGGLLLVHETQPHRAGVLVAARVDGEGRIGWRADTGIGELLDVLPDADAPAFIGTRPRVPDTVPEPILVIVDAARGSVVTHSLWLK